MKKSSQFSQVKWTGLCSMCRVLVICSSFSGTGTIRRNPDLKWKFSQQHLDNLIKTQRDIFKTSLKYIKPGGKILYSTCSLLSDENERQIEHFVKTYGLELHNGKYFQSLPQTGGFDGFFSAVLIAS